MFLFRSWIGLCIGIDKSNLHVRTIKEFFVYSRKIVRRKYKTEKEMGGKNTHLADVFLFH